MLVEDLPPQTEWHFKPLLEVRERYEARLDRDFDGDRPDRKIEMLTRFRPGVEVTVGKHWKAQLVYEYTHGLVWSPQRNFSTEGSNLVIGNVQWQSPELKVVVGRQKLSIGSERLVASGDWGNRQRVFDGVYVSGKDWEAFGAEISMNSPPVPDARIAGVTKKWRGGQSLLLYKHNRTPKGEDRVWTLDHIYKRTLDKLDVDLEGAYQLGRKGDIDHEAWAIHAAVGYRPRPSTRFFAEFNAGSGGASLHKSRAFDSLFPSNHQFYGSMDMIGWKNMQEFAVGVEHRFNKATTGKLAYRRFTLQDSRDAWYGPGGSPNRWGGGDFVDPTGRSGRNLGQEIDLEFTHRPSGNWSFSAGVGVFLPGSFVENVSGKRDRQWWGYVQATFKL